MAYTRGGVRVPEGVVVDAHIVHPVLELVVDCGWVHVGKE